MTAFRQRAAFVGRPLAWSLMLVATCACAAPGSPGAEDASSLEQLGEPTRPVAFWRGLLAQNAGKPARQAAIYRLACLQRLSPSSADDIAFSEEAVSVGLPLARQVGSARDVAGLLICGSRLDESAGRTDKAEADLGTALAQSTLAQDTELQAMALAMRGELRYGRADLFNAQVDIQAAHALVQHGKNRLAKAYVLNALANLYTDRRIAQYQKALDIYRQLLPMVDDGEHERSLANARFNMAVVYKRLERHDEALAAFAQAQAALAAIGDEVGVAYCLYNRADTLLRLNRPAEALAAAQQSLAALQGIEDVAAHATARLVQAAALRRLGRNDEAQQAVALIRKRHVPDGNPRFQLMLEEEAAEVAAASGQWESAFKARSEQLKLAKVIELQQNEGQGARLRAEFESQRQEAENERLRQQADSAAQVQALQLALIAVGG